MSKDITPPPALAAALAAHRAATSGDGRAADVPDTFTLPPETDVSALRPGVYRVNDDYTLTRKDES